jgi:serine O-acetyltransferase
MQRTPITQHDISAALAADEVLAYTPTEQQVKDAVTDFLKTQPNWVLNAISNDAAVNTKPNKVEQISEVLKYQGLHALAFHKQAHELYEKARTERDPEQRDVLYLEARTISQGVRRLTAGIEIHPGAKIGQNCFIDHGASLVVGETAEIGDNVFIYHGVTLGAVDGTQDTGGRRHPKIGNKVTISNGVQILGPATIEDGVEIGAGAKIIGNITIGKGVKIAPGVEVRKSIPAIGQGENPGDIMVVGATPNLPGITTKDEAYAPIYFSKSQHFNGDTPLPTIKELAWHEVLVKSLQSLVGIPSRA